MPCTQYIQGYPARSLVRESIASTWEKMSRQLGSEVESPDGKKSVCSILK